MITNPSDYGWYPMEYKVDIYKRLKSLEKERSAFGRQSPQFEYRSSLIQWLRKVFREVKFCRVTLHLAVFLLDYFMDTHSIHPEKLTLVAMLCFTLAGKFAEREANVPKISEINEILENAYTKMDIIYFEGKILEHFKWKLTMPTALHFAEYFMEYAVAPQDICQNCSNLQYVFSIIRNSVNDYLDVTLEDDDLIENAPSLVAASSILAVRKSFKMNPTWPKTLENVSQYKEEELKDCASQIIKSSKNLDAEMTTYYYNMGLVAHVQFNHAFFISKFETGTGEMHLGFRESYQQQRKRKLDQSPDHGYETENSSPCSLKSRRETIDE